MTVPELKALLNAHGIERAIHDRGQHFLLSDEVVRRMVEAAQVGPGSTVLEIGPGPGILTDKLLAAGATVVAVEVDPKMCELQRARFGENPRFHLHFSDIREAVAMALLADAGRSDAAYSVVANIPYHITSDLITRFLGMAPRPERVVLLVQKEVGERMTAKPGDMSALAVFVQAQGAVRIVTQVSAGQFYPPPKVDSCVIEIVPAKPLAHAEAFFAFVRFGFGHARKKLRNTLAGQFADVATMERAFVAAGVSPDARPEEVSVEQWRGLFSGK
jgi:16S rRNA (adenine1518-N6/adenine1519-N6)-dimethyltransferase